MFSYLYSKHEIEINVEPHEAVSFAEYVQWVDRVINQISQYLEMDLASLLFNSFHETFIYEKLYHY